MGKVNTSKPLCKETRPATGPYLVIDSGWLEDYEEFPALDEAIDIARNDVDESDSGELYILQVVGKVSYPKAKSPTLTLFQE